jgi:hypothetical protein
VHTSSVIEFEGINSCLEEHAVDLPRRDTKSQETLGQSKRTVGQSIEERRGEERRGESESTEEARSVRAYCREVRSVQTSPVRASLAQGDASLAQGGASLIRTNMISLRRWSRQNKFHIYCAQSNIIFIESKENWSTCQECLEALMHHNFIIHPAFLFLHKFSFSIWPSWVHSVIRIGSAPYIPTSTSESSEYPESPLFSLWVNL